MSQISSKVAHAKGSSRRRLKEPGLSGVVNDYVYGRGGKSNKANALEFTPSRIIEFIEEGLPIRELDDLQSTLNVDMEKLTSMLGISKATLHRRKAEGRLEPAES